MVGVKVQSLSLWYIYMCVYIYVCGYVQLDNNQKDKVVARQSVPTLTSRDYLSVKDSAGIFFLTFVRTCLWWRYPYPNPHLSVVEVLVSSPFLPFRFHPFKGQGSKAGSTWGKQWARSVSNRLEFPLGNKSRTLTIRFSSCQGNSTVCKNKQDRS